MRRPWTSGELEALRQLAPRLGGAGCAAAFGRTRKSVERQAARLGVSLRPTNSGGMTGVSCSPAVLKRIRTLPEADLCPCCGKRPVGAKATGFCWRCHFELLCAAHEEETAKIEGQRELWAARSRLQRRRRAVAAACPDDLPESGDARESMGNGQPVTSEKGS